MQRNTRWTGLYTAILCVAGFGPARADITAVLPVEGGTIGTEITLMGSGFGEKRGKVQLGTEACQIRSWGDTIVICEVVTPQPAGDYTVTLSPQGSTQGNKKVPQPMTFSSFTLRAPQVTPGDPLQLVAPGQRVTIAGAFFGDKKGEVYLRDTPGDTVAAKVRDWSMDSISFEIPKGLTGYLTLGVTNEVGLGIQPFWGTLTPLPPGAFPISTATNILVRQGAQVNASGVYFNGALWVFTPYADNGLFTKHNTVYVCTYKNGALAHVPQCGGKTYATVVPLVINHELWAFVTGEDSGLYYKRFRNAENAWENGDGSWNQIGDLKTDDKYHEIAPAYNSISNRLEVYYNHNNTLYLTVSGDRGLNWSGGQPVAGMTPYPVVSAPSAVFYQQTATNGVTLLAAGVSAPDGVYPVVFSVQNGTVVRTHWLDRGLHSRPFLADLGEDYFGMVWTAANNTKPLMQKVNKHTGQWITQYTALAKDTFWPPNLAVSYEQQTDTHVPPVLRWNANLYLFWGNEVSNGGDMQDAWMNNIETLGFWQEEGPATTSNFGLDETNCFQFWSVLGVVDAPPFIVNGDEDYIDDARKEPNPTRVEFGVEQSNTVESTTRWSVGPYIETGEKSPIKIEASYSYAEENASGLETTVKFESTLYRGTNSPVMVFYLTPEVEVHHVRWYNADGATTNYMYPLLFTPNTTYQCLTFDPTTFPVPGASNMPATYFDLAKFPVHKRADDRERLDSYPMPTNAFWNTFWFQDTLNWMNSQGQGIVWDRTTNTTRTTSNSIEYKIGVGYEKILGVGVQGSWEATTKTTTTMTTSAEVHIEDPFPGPISHFTVVGRWLEPDSSGYWVPVNRQQMGDVPWFITYGVTNVR